MQGVICVAARRKTGTHNCQNAKNARERIKEVTGRFRRKGISTLFNLIEDPPETGPPEKGLTSIET